MTFSAFFFITSRRYFENNQPQAKSWLFKFSFLLKKNYFIVNLRISYIETLCVTYLNWKTNEKVHKREGLIN